MLLGMIPIDTRPAKENDKLSRGPGGLRGKRPGGKLKAAELSVLYRKPARRDRGPGKSRIYQRNLIERAKSG